MSKDPYHKIMILIANTINELDKENPSRERSLVQTKLDEAMMWAERGRSQAIKPAHLEERK